MKKISVSFFLFGALATSPFLLAQNEPVKQEGQLVGTVAESESSPLMMSGFGEKKGSWKNQNEKQSDVTARHRRFEETEERKGDNESSKVTESLTTFPETGGMPTTEEIKRQAVDCVKKTVTLNAATELHQEKLNAQQNYNNAVSEEVLLGNAVEQANELADQTEQQLKAQQQLHQQKVRQYVWSDRDFSKWELPGELPEVVIPPGDPDLIVPPEMLHEEAEELGRRLFAEAMNTLENKQEENNNSSSSSSSSQQDLMSEEERIKNEIIAEGLSFSDEKLSEEQRALIEQRLATRARANELHKRAALLAKESRRLREVQAAAKEKASAADETNSIFSRVSSTVFGALSKANTVRVTTSSSRSMDLETAARLAEEAELIWERLALEAEKVRSQNSRTSLEDQVVLRVWHKADQELLSLHQKENAAKTLQESWQENSQRWQLRVKAEIALQRLRQAEANFAIAQENKLIVHERYLRAKATEVEKEEASETKRMTQEDINAARIAANEAEKAWEEVALQHKSVKNYSNNEEREEALKKLYYSDQAVVNLWFELTDRYAGDEDQEELTLEALQAREKQESNRYVLKQKKDLARYFGATSEVGLVLADAKNTYRNGNKAGAKELYDRANELEIKACHDYMEAAKQDALEAARKRVPELAAFWIQRKSAAQAEQEVKTTAASFKKKTSDSWADETDQALQHATALAAAEEVAFHVYQAEEQRLNDIETLFIAIIAAKKKALLERPAQAAKAYFSGDQTLWSHLSEEERERYNQEVRRENEIYEASFNKSFQITREKVERLRNKIRQTLLYVSNSDRASLSEGEAQLAKFEHEHNERKKMIQVVQFSPEAQKEFLKEEIKTRHLKQDSQHADSLRGRLEKNKKLYSNATNSHVAHELSVLIEHLETTESRYVKAHGEEKKNHSKAALAFRKSAEILLKNYCGVEFDLGRNTQVSGILSSAHRKAQILADAGKVYAKIAEEEEKIKKNEKAIMLWSKSAHASEQAAIVEQEYIDTGFGNILRHITASNLYSDMVTALHPDASLAYDQAAEQEIIGSEKGIKAYLKCAEYCEQSTEIFKTALTALTLGDKKRAKIYGMKARTLSGTRDHPGIGWAYSQVGRLAKRQTNLIEDPKLEALFKKATKSYADLLDACLTRIQYCDDALHEQENNNQTKADYYYGCAEGLYRRIDYDVEQARKEEEEYIQSLQQYEK